VECTILCTGPSLAHYLEAPVEQPNCSIGVNQAVEARACDWWCFSDPEAFDWFNPLGHPRIFTSRACLDIITRRADIPRFDWTFHADIGTEAHSDWAWPNYSLTCALVLAEHLGARTVEIYGCDWSGDRYFDGQPARRTHDMRYRWKNEQHKYGMVTDWMARKGIEVKRRNVETEKRRNAETTAS
jgi:hypothetical protein